MNAPNEPLVLRAGGMSLLPTPTSDLVPLSGLLRFRWQPSIAAEFDGEMNLHSPELGTTATLLFDSRHAQAEVIVTHLALGGDRCGLRCVLSSHVELIHESTPVSRLRFYLANFPDYVGDAVKLDNASDRGWFRGRLQLVAASLCCTVDAIPEVAEARKQAVKDAGFVISHVCEVAFSTPQPHSQLLSHLSTLHLFFGLLRGAWAGPVLPRGYSGSSLVWEQFAAWLVDDPREVNTWLPQRSPLDLSLLWEKFLDFARSPTWAQPLTTALSWYIAANSSREPLEVRIVLAQVALEMLASVEVVEQRALRQSAKFARTGAAARIRALLDHLRVPVSVPPYLQGLSQLASALNQDGPGVIVYIRNRLAHATESSRRDLTSVSGDQLWEAAQLSIQYVELCLLALLDYRGRYARRGWRGWKGEDEVNVPWV